jgi:hypothetical protein
MMDTRGPHFGNGGKPKIGPDRRHGGNAENHQQERGHQGPAADASQSDQQSG